MRFSLVSIFRRIKWTVCWILHPLLLPAYQPQPPLEGDLPRPARLPEAEEAEEAEEVEEA